MAEHEIDDRIEAEKDRGTISRCLPPDLIAFCTQSGTSLYLFGNKGIPIDAWSWVVLIGCVLLWFPLLFVRRLWFVVLWMAILVCVDLSLLMPWGVDEIADIRGGRQGVVIRPWGCGFGVPTRDMHLLTESVGTPEAEWRSTASDRVNTRGVLHSYSGLYYLERSLPDEAAFRQVALCLTDPDNLMRVHQNLLLVCLLVEGYPPGYDAESWWKRHAPLFRREYDPRRAVESTYGWIGATARFSPRDPNTHSWIDQLRQAAIYQETGRFGGDPEFAAAYAEYAKSDKDPGAIPAAVRAVAWWPDDPRFLDGTLSTPGKFRRLTTSPWVAPRRVKAR